MENTNINISMRAMDISLYAIAVFALIKELGGTATFSKLLYVARVSPPTLMKALTELIKAGVLLKKENPNDRRSYIYTVTN